MNARELKIGNWLVYPGWRKDGSDAQFMVRDLYYENEKIGLTTGAIQTRVDISHVKPIPLTKEWLVNLGFKKGNFYYLPTPRIKAEIHYETHSYGNVVTIQSDFGMLIPEDIKYVHQIQNLYFALTGEELELKNENGK